MTKSFKNLQLAGRIRAAGESEARDLLEINVISEGDGGAAGETAAPSRLCSLSCCVHSP